MIIPQTGGKEGKHFKLLVRVNISQPLLKGTTMKMNGIIKWPKFKYERCPDFCYNCGMIGHSDKNYKVKVTVGKGWQENQYRPWSRVASEKTSPQKDSRGGKFTGEKHY